MNAHASPRRVILGAVLSLVLSACSSAVGSPGSSSASPSAVPPSGPANSLEPSLPPPTPSASPTPAATVGDIECPGSATGGDIDYVADADGGLPDLEAATRALRGILQSDQVAIDDHRSAVIRNGRIVFSGSWFQSRTGGWLLSSFSACGDAHIGMGPPRGLVRDAIAEVVADTLRVRGLPSTADSSAKFERLLGRSDQVFIVDGPVKADGYEWYLVQAMVEEGSEPGAPFGWVAAASRDGEPWIEDVEETTCPRVPEDASRFGVMPPEVLVHCFGSRELTFELDANVYCLPDEVRQVEPAWFGAGCGELSGDACGSCGLSIAADPGLGISIPREQAGHWAFRGHFDDPAAATCHGPAAGDTRVAEQFGIHLCRMTFVLTSLKRLGDA
jgi:hypothetical protein